jgi:hypothetical protein
MNRAKAEHLSLRLVLLAAALSTGCGGPTTPSPVVSPPATLSDLRTIAEGIVQELRNHGLDVVIAEQVAGGALSVAAQRIDIPANPAESIYVHVYATAGLASAEASRLLPDGNLAPGPGNPAPPRVTYWQRQYFHYRDRVIARYGGCDAAFRNAMASIFGPPLVVADGIVECGLER